MRNGRWQSPRPPTSLRPGRFPYGGRLRETTGRPGFLLLCALVAGWMAVPAVPAADEGIRLAPVVVTGTRIRQDPLQGVSPVLTLTSEQLEGAGVSSVGDVLQRLPISGSPLTTRFNSSGNFGFPADGGGISAGASQVDLRHLGAKRVLVLVDGLRWVNGTSGSGVPGATDLNTIPLSIIDRIEVFGDGASAIYGSDGIAGVVNIITRRNIDGVEMSGSAGTYPGGGAARDFAASFGGTGERLSAALSVSYENQEELGSASRRQSRFPRPGTDHARHGSTFTPQGRVVFTDPRTDEFINCALDEGVTGTPVYDPADPCGDGDDYHPWTNADRFNYAPWNLLLTPSERVGLYGQARYELTDTLRLYARALYNTRKSRNRAAPEPLWIGELGGTGNLMDRTAIDVANPFNPFGFTIGPGGAFLTRRPLESGARLFEQEVDTRYVAAGLQGEFELGGRAMFWDLNGVWARNHARQRKTGAHDARKMRQAVGPADGCTSPCVPLNFLGGQGDGGGTLTPDMLDWIGFVQRDSSEQRLVDITANVTGDLVELPAGPLAFAAGAERRAQDGAFRPDPVVAAGDTAGLPAQPTAGGFDVNALYAEIDVPLASGRSGADLLAVSAAARAFDYSTFGTGTTMRLGARWRPAGDLLLRGTFAEGFRSPNIGELFGGHTRFDAALADPCSDFRNSGATPATVENCIADGVPADGSYRQSLGQVGTLTGGNPALQPETSDSFTLGAVYRPSWARRLAWIDDLSLELTYYDHRIDGTIAAFDAQTVLDGCYEAGVQLFCDFVDRGERGGIARFENMLLNAGSIKTNGLDFNLAFRSPELSFSRFRILWHNTFLGAFTEVLRDSHGREIERRSLAGRAENDRAKPRWKSTLAVDWFLGNWDLSWRSRYIDSTMERCSNFLDGSPDSLTNLGLCSHPDFDNDRLSENRLGGTLYNDVRATWHLPGLRGSLGFGVNNLFDRDPPASQSATLNGYVASTYDIPGGRFVYVRFAYEFD